jgi:hypothetical protein
MFSIYYRVETIPMTRLVSGYLPCMITWTHGHGVVTSESLCISSRKLTVLVGRDERGDPDIIIFVTCSGMVYIL